MGRRKVKLFPALHLTNPAGEWSSFIKIRSFLRRPGATKEIKQDGIDKPGRPGGTQWTGGVASQEEQVSPELRHQWQGKPENASRSRDLSAKSGSRKEQSDSKVGLGWPKVWRGEGAESDTANQGTLGGQHTRHSDLIL